MLWWLVPIADLWMPYRVVREVQLRMDPASHRGSGAWLARAWWIAWLSNSIAAIPVLLALGGSSANRLLAYVILSMVAFVAAFLAVAVIVRIQQTEDRMAGGTVRVR